MATLGAEFWIPAIISAASTATSSILSYQAASDQAKQTEMNAEAQQKAIQAERLRKSAELAENQRRLAVQERRERAQQFSALASSGFAATTGTPLAIMSDTSQGQQERRADLVNQGNLTDWQLTVQGNTLMQEAQSQASALRGQAGATLLSGLGNTVSTGYGMYSNRPQKAKSTTPTTVP